MTSNDKKIGNRDIPGLLEQRAQLENVFDMTFYVPCYNEEGNVASTLGKLKSVMSQYPLTYEILAFNDASTDNTLREMEKFREQNPDMIVRIVDNRRNLGLGYNYMEGAFLGLGRYYMLVNGDDS